MTAPGFFDVKTPPPEEKWIRVFLTKGDLLVLPPGVRPLPSSCSLASSLLACTTAADSLSLLLRRIVLHSNFIRSSPLTSPLAPPDRPIRPYPDLPPLHARRDERDPGDATVQGRAQVDAVQQVRRGTSPSFDPPRPVASPTTPSHRPCINLSSPLPAPLSGRISTLPVADIGLVRLFVALCLGSGGCEPAPKGVAREGGRQGMSTLVSSSLRHPPHFSSFSLILFLCAPSQSLRRCDLHVRLRHDNPRWFPRVIFPSSDPPSP